MVDPHGYAGTVIELNGETAMVWFDYQATKDPKPVPLANLTLIR